MEEGERVKAVEERKKKTTLTEKETLHNDLIDLANRVQKSRGNEKTNLQGQIRQRVRELNAKLGEEIYKYDGVSVRAKVKSKTKGERYLKIKGTTRDTSGRAIKEDAVLLFDRSPEFVQKYEELADSPNITALQVDSGNGVTMTAEQIESALQDIADGIPSVQADNLLNALEEGFNRGYFDLRGKDIGQDRVQASVEDFIGVQQEEVGQPMDEEALMEYLNDESQFSPQEDEQISEDLKNLINEYESQPQKAIIEREVPKAKPTAEVGSPKPTQPNEKGKADGESKADISKEPIGEAKKQDVEDWSKDVESTAKALEGKDIYEIDKKIEKVYHGTSYDIQKPTIEKYGQVHEMGGMLGKAVYYTPSIEEAKYFADLSVNKNRSGIKKVIEGVLNAKNIISVTDLIKNVNENTLQKWINDSGKKYVTVKDVKERVNIESNEKSLTNWLSSINDISVLAKMNGNDAVTWGYENGKPNEIAIIDDNLVETNKVKYISEAYHKSKADGSNPELIKAVEDLLGNHQRARHAFARGARAKNQTLCRRAGT